MNENQKLRKEIYDKFSLIVLKYKEIGAENLFKVNNTITIEMKLNRDEFDKIVELYEEEKADYYSDRC